MASLQEDRVAIEFLKGDETMKEMTLRLFSKCWMERKSQKDGKVRSYCQFIREMVILVIVKTIEEHLAKVYERILEKG